MAGHRASSRQVDMGVWVVAIVLCATAMTGSAASTNPVDKCQVPGFTYYRQQNSRFLGNLAGAECLYLNDSAVNPAQLAATCSGIVTGGYCQGFFLEEGYPSPDSNAQLPHSCLLVTPAELPLRSVENTRMPDNGCWGLYMKECPVPKGYSFQWGVVSVVRDDRDVMEFPPLTMNYQDVVNQAANQCGVKYQPCVAFSVHTRTGLETSHTVLYYAQYPSRTDVRVGKTNMCDGLFIDLNAIDLSAAPGPSKPTSQPGVIAGIVIGSVVGLASLALLGFWLWKRHVNQDRSGKGMGNATSLYDNPMNDEDDRL